MTKQKPKADTFNAAAFDVALTETNALLVAHGKKPLKDMADVMRRLKKADLSKVLKL